MSAPVVTYTARSVAILAAVTLLLVIGLSLIVIGAWAQWGWPVGVMVLGAALIAQLLAIALWPAGSRTAG